MTNGLPDRELTPTELRQLIESNARAIAANTAGNAELRESIAAIGQRIDSVNTALGQRIDTLGQRVDQLTLASQRTEQIAQDLLQEMRQYFSYQAHTNRVFDGALEDHEQRIQNLEGEQ
jgi:hypothetical protein